MSELRKFIHLLINNASREIIINDKSTVVSDCTKAPLLNNGITKIKLTP